MSDDLRATIEELRRLEREATPEEWSARNDDLADDECASVWRGDTMLAEVPGIGFGDRQPAFVNARLIAAMRNALPALLDAAERGLERTEVPEHWGIPAIDPTDVHRVRQLYNADANARLWEAVRPLLPALLMRSDRIPELVAVLKGQELENDRLRSRVEDLEAALALAVQKGEASFRDDDWQPMETAPKDGTWFLWGQPEGNPHCCVIRWPEYEECWSAPGGRWRPLPAPPGTGDE